MITFAIWLGFACGLNLMTAESEALSWLPGTPVVCRYDLSLPANLPSGEYQVAIGLFDTAPSKARPVEFALQLALRDEAGYYRMAMMQVTAP